MFAISDNKQPQPKEFFVGNAEHLEGCGAKLVSTTRVYYSCLKTKKNDVSFILEIQC